MTKRIASLCACLLLVLGSQSQANKPDPNFHLYLLIGQSNMAGRGTLDAESKLAHPHIMMLDSNDYWLPATDPVHFDKPKQVGVGPAIGFAKEMLQQDSTVTIGLIPCAWGGSPISVWQPGKQYFQAHPYDDAIRRTQLAMQQGVLKGILWHQGESDNDSTKSKVYLEKLTALVKRLRTDLEAPALPFVAGEIGYFNDANYINPVIDQLPSQLPYTAVVSAKGLDHKGDHLHFNSASARELGKRYAEAMIALQKNSDHTAAAHKRPPIVLFCFDDAEESHYSNVAPLLKQYGYNASFMVCEMPRKSPGDSVYYMNWPQIAALYKMGFEIGSHTGHHKNMTKLSEEQKKLEIDYIENKCREYGIPKPVSFAYPGNRDDSLSQIVLQEMGYTTARTGGSRYFNPTSDSWLAIPSYTMGSSEKLKERTWKALQELQPGDILAFTIHGVPDIAHPDYSTTVEDLKSFLDYIQAHHIKVMTLGQLAGLKQ